MNKLWNEKQSLRGKKQQSHPIWDKTLYFVVKMTTLKINLKKSFLFRTFMTLQKQHKQYKFNNLISQSSYFCEECENASLLAKAIVRKSVLFYNSRVI